MGMIWQVGSSRLRSRASLVTMESPRFLARITTEASMMSAVPVAPQSFCAGAGELFIERDNLDFVDP